MKSVLELKKLAGTEPLVQAFYKHANSTSICFFYRQIADDYADKRPLIVTVLLIEGPY
jgi:hypothetical protein